MSDEDTLLRARRLHEGKSLAEASSLYRAILAANPAHVDALTLLGLAQAEQGCFDEASRLLSAALKHAPNAGWTHFHLGQVHQSLNRLEDALASFDRAIAVLPAEPEIHIRRATILRALDRPKDAIDGYEAALAMQRSKAAAWYGRGMALTTLGRFDEALPDFEKAVSLEPRQYAGQLNLGMAYERAGRLELAAAQFIAVAERFREDVSRHTRALNEAGRILTDLERYEEAQALLRQSLMADPTQETALQDITFVRQAACLWPVVLPFGPVSRDAILQVMDPLQIVSFSDDPMLQLALNARYVRQLTKDCGEVRPASPPSPAKRRLRIGYLSADFRNHPVPHLMYDVFGLHDRTRFEIYSYHIGPRNDDALYRHVRDESDVFVDIAHLDDPGACRRIIDDDVDILVDLTGHTFHARPGIFARKPAPIIVNWLGYPGTMGSADHHYILADDWVIPKGQERFYSEKVLRLPCYQPNPRRRVAAEEAIERSDFGLPEKGFVFCCFNTPWKVTPESFGRWMTILRGVEDSVLWLLAPQVVQERLRARAVASGVDGSRLIFGERLPNPEHLARHTLADLFLDTAPYGAHTTCSDALWMGVPVITLSGQSFASRVCGSLLRNAGLPDLVFANSDDFVREAVAIAKDPERLRDYRARLAATRDHCTLFDIDEHVRRLEELYEEMWRDHLAGALPRPDLKLLETDLSVRDAMDRSQTL